MSSIRLCAVVIVAGSLAACGGGTGSSGGAPPVVTPSVTQTPAPTAAPTTTPGVGPTASSTIVVPANGGAVALPAVSGFSGSLNLGAPSAGACASLTIVTQAYSPPGLPVIQARHTHAQFAANVPQFFVSLTFASTCTMNGLPGFIVSLPSSVNLQGTFELAFYDLAHPANGWQVISSPLGGASTITFPSQGKPFTFTANQTYVFAVIEGNIPTPTPGPTPTPAPTATPSPVPGSIASLNYTLVNFNNVVPMSNVIVGPDGALWIPTCASQYSFANGGITRVSASLSVTTYLLPSGAVRCPFSITAGPDGAMWFTETNATIGRITTSGSITEYPLPRGSSGGAIALGSDGNLWYAADNKEIDGFATSTQSLVGTAALPSGFQPSQLASNPGNGDMVVVLTPSSAGGNGQIARFTPGSSPSVTSVFQDAHLNSANYNSIAIASDGYIYALLSQMYGAEQTLVKLEQSNYAESTVTLPSAWITSNGYTNLASLEAPVLYGGGKLFIIDFDPRALSGLVEFNTSGVALGQSPDGWFHLNSTGGVYGADGKAYYLYVTIGLGGIEQVTPI